MPFTILKRKAKTVNRSTLKGSFKNGLLTYFLEKSKSVGLSMSDRKYFLKGFISFCTCAFVIRNLWQ